MFQYIRVEVWTKDSCLWQIYLMHGENRDYMKHEPIVLCAVVYLFRPLCLYSVYSITDCLRICHILPIDHT